MSKKPLMATLMGSDLCICEGITVQEASPVFRMCQKLVQAGIDPERPMYCFRGGEIVLKISTIGWGAQHTVGPCTDVRKYHPGPQDRKTEVKTAHERAERKGRRPKPPRDGRYYSRKDLQWDGLTLRLEKRRICRVIGDPAHPGMYRVQRNNGSVSDMFNLDRAKDAAVHYALFRLNGTINAPVKGKRELFASSQDKAPANHENAIDG